MRLAHRSTLLFVASAVSLSLACGGGDDGGDDDTGPIEGTSHQYVVSKLELPTSEDTPLKFDVDGDGDVENKLGRILSLLNSQAGGTLNLQGSLDTSINEGDITLLADVVATAYPNAANAGLRVYLGNVVSPNACENEADTTCGKHLQGTGTFTLKNASANSEVAGNIVNGRFTGKNGALQLQIALEGSTIDLALINAQADISVSDTGVAAGSKVGGGITVTEIQNNVIPAVHKTLETLVTRDCAAATPPSCTCVAGSPMAQLLGIFDKIAPVDCKISLAEVQQNSFIETLLSPDLDLLDDVPDNDSVSVVVGVTAVKASW